MITKKFKVWARRESSILVSADGTYSNAEWLPTNILTIQPCLNRGYRGFANITLPKHIAEARFDLSAPSLR